MKVSLEPTKQAAQIKAPVDTNNGGELRDSIIIARVSPRHRRHEKSDLEMAVGPRGGKGGISYAAQQEFGNINHGAQPFMRPAWDATKMTVLLTFRDELWDNIEKALLRQSRKIARDAAKLKQR